METFEELQRMSKGRRLLESNGRKKMKGRSGVDKKTKQQEQRK